MEIMRQSKPRGEASYTYTSDAYGAGKEGPMMDGKLTHLSLFSGIGGLDLAAEWAGFKTVGQCEQAEYPAKVLQKHWPDVPRWRDVHGLSANEFFARTGIKRGGLTCLSGGFPCQPHSSCGKRQASNDERDLWPEFYRVICDLDPRWVVAENVRGLLSSEHGRFFGRVLRDLARWGSGVWWYCFPAAALGASFRGDRVAVVASSPSVRLDDMDEDLFIGPDAVNLERMEKWKARQNSILPHMGRPLALPERRHHRNDDGLSAQLDRFKCLGNSVAPPQFYPIFKSIHDFEMAGKEK